MARDDWFELRPGPANVARLRALGTAESDPDGLARKKRGIVYGLSALRFEWTGTSLPPDFLPISPTAEIISHRVLGKLKSAGIRGLSDLPVGIRLADGTTADFSLLVVEHEVSSVCFGRSDRLDSGLTMLRDPQIEGLDGGIADVFVLPYALGLHHVLVSSRFVEIARYCGMSNVAFPPLAELTVSRPDPDQLLC